MADNKDKVAVIKQRRGEVKALFEKNKGAIGQALPKFITPERMIKVALTCINTTPKLLEATNASLMSCLIQSAQLGLVPDGILGQSYLLPFENNRRGIVECQFIIGYKGYIQLAYRSGQVNSFQPRAVYEQDDFRFQFGLNEELHHVPTTKTERGELTHVYAVIHMKDGGHMFDVMSKAEVEEVRAMSKAPNSPAWKNHYASMAMKSVIRRLAKMAPLSSEFQKAAALDELGELKDKSQGLAVTLDDSIQDVEDVNVEIVEEAEVVEDENREERKATRANKAKDATQETLDLIGKK